MSKLSKEDEELLQSEMLRFVRYLLNPNNGFFGQSNIKALIDGIVHLSENAYKLKDTKEKIDELKKSVANLGDKVNKMADATNNLNAKFKCRDCGTDNFN